MHLPRRQDRVSFDGGICTHAAWPARSPPEGGVGDLVAPFRRVSRQPPGRRPPRPRVPAQRQPLHAPGPAGWSTPAHDRGKAHSPSVPGQRLHCQQHANHHDPV